MVVDVKNISMMYLTGDYRQVGFKEFVIQKLTKKSTVQEFWALRDITFQLEEGDFLGIIGTNGSGKTTLLKALSGVMQPKKGTVKVNGRISALLGLATGFDGELTVKENTYLRGALLGYTEDFLNEMYDEIIEFAELKEFENRKFRQLSSGMQSRLAFSIASLMDPDVLILDEVLAVGDGAFRAKSEKRMMEIINSGITTILVSHSTVQIRKLCNKALWIEKGKQMAFGDAKSVCAQYDAYLKSKNV